MTYNKMDPIVVLALGLVTCGLYMLYWNYKTAQDVNAITGKEHIAPVIALLCGCCMPANIYFFYVIGQALPQVGQKVNVPMEDKSTLLLILGFLLPPVAAMIAQGELNRCYETVQK